MDTEAQHVVHQVVLVRHVVEHLAHQRGLRGGGYAKGNPAWGGSTPMQGPEVFWGDGWSSTTLPPIWGGVKTPFFLVGHWLPPPHVLKSPSLEVQGKCRYRFALPSGDQATIAVA